jgi:DNA-binding response OmpR family regulator
MSADQPPGGTILVVNDQEWTARSLESILAARGFSVVRAFTARQAIERATELVPDGFVLDVQLPDLDGMALCRQIRENPMLGPSIPVILTTAGPSGRPERLEALRAGAWEFVGHPLDGETLLLKLEVFLASKRVADQLRRENVIDPETGLYSRAGLLRRCREMATDGVRRNRLLGCVVLRPNAGSGSASDRPEELGRRVGAFLRCAGRSADAIGRLSLIEFGVVTLGAGIEELRALVGRLNQALPRALGEAGVGVSLSAAVWSATELGQDLPDPETLLQRAANAIGAGELPLAVLSSG